MDTKQKEDRNKKKNPVLHITILIIVVSLTLIAVTLATRNFDFTDFVLKLHGG